MEFKPSKIKRDGIIITFVLFISAFIFYILLAFDVGFSIVNQIGMVVLFTCAIIILIRFVLVDFVYKINEDGYLTIHRVYGRNSKMLADIKISADDSAVLGKSEIDKRGKPDVKENFASSMFPQSVIGYYFMSGGKRHLIILEGGRDLFEVLKEAIEKYGKNDSEENG